MNEELESSLSRRSDNLTNLDFCFRSINLENHNRYCYTVPVLVIVLFDIFDGDVTTNVLFGEQTFHYGVRFTSDHHVDGGLYSGGLLPKVQLKSTVQKIQYALKYNRK